MEGGEADVGVGVFADVNGSHVDLIRFDVFHPDAGNEQVAGLEFVDAGTVEAAFVV